MDESITPNLSYAHPINISTDENDQPAMLAVQTRSTTLFREGRRER